MKGLLCFVVLLVSLFCLAAGKPQAPPPKVQLIRYNSDSEADAIIRNVIAQYDQIRGTSEYHNYQAPYVQPNQVRALSQV